MPVKRVGEMTTNDVTCLIRVLDQTGYRPKTSTEMVESTIHLEHREREYSSTLGIWVRERDVVTKKHLRTDMIELTIDQSVFPNRYTMELVIGQHVHNDKTYASRPTFIGADIMVQWMLHVGLIRKIDFA